MKNETMMNPNVMIIYTHTVIMNSFPHQLHSKSNDKVDNMETKN